MRGMSEIAVPGWNLACTPIAERIHVEHDPKKTTPRPLTNWSLGLDGLVRGLDNLLQAAAHITDATDDDEAAAEGHRTGTVGSPKGVHAVYGVSVRLGARGRPVVSRFGNVRQNARRSPVVDPVREPMADVLDEGDHYLVVAELPGVEASDVDWSLRDDRRLVIRAESAGRRYHREIELTEPVDAGKVGFRYENGVLELTLSKRQR
jgi:HSP20 family protein